MIELAAIPRESVGLMWPIIEPGIQKMLDHGLGVLSPDDIREAASAGDTLLFVVVQDGELEPMAVLICYVAIGQKRVFEISMTWGEQMSEWFDIAYDGLLKVALELKCDMVAITGRRGWIKQLRSRGFSEKLVTLIKELP